MTSNFQRKIKTYVEIHCYAILQFMCAFLGEEMHMSSQLFTSRYICF